MSFYTPYKTFESVERLGDGDFKADFHVYTLDVHSSKIFKGPIKKVRSDEEYRKAATEYAKELPPFEKSTCVKSSDGVPLIYFIKKGITSPWGILASFMVCMAMSAIQLLLSAYPPPQNLKTNARHKSNLKAEIEKSELLSRPYGVFHWNYWVPEGQRKPTVALEARPKDPTKLKALESFISNTKSEHFIISMWMMALDPEVWQLYNQHYQKARINGNLGILDTGAWGVQSSHTFLVNAIANPHKDPGDVKKGWTITYPWGLFTGGEVVFVDLGLKFAQQSGDMLMAPASVLTHMVLPHEGDRYSHIWFTKANVLNPPAHRFFCNIGSCTNGYASKVGLRKHWERKKEDYHEATRQRRAAGKDVESDNSMAFRGDDYNVDDLDDAASDTSDSSEYEFGAQMEETEVTESSRPRKKQKTTHDSLALPAGAPTDTRKRFWCDISGCEKSEARDFKGYTASDTVRKHKNACHQP